MKIVKRNKKYGQKQYSALSLQYFTSYQIQNSTHTHANKIQIVYMMKTRRDSIERKRF